MYSNEPESWVGTTIYTYKSIFHLPKSGAIIRVLNPDFDLTSYISKEMNCLISIDSFSLIPVIEEAQSNLTDQLNGIVKHQENIIPGEWCFGASYSNNNDWYNLETDDGVFLLSSGEANWVGCAPGDSVYLDVMQFRLVAVHVLK